ncbi:hypothetical protein R3P38DRAFT_3356046 [Favolaschia claudopus]|uniref:Cytochrome c biogenesis B n=1 Tax=Favolaschia claudopus TaxID=2862362 RepID=A0AAW0BFR0_9AGAR
MTFASLAVMCDYCLGSKLLDAVQPLNHSSCPSNPFLPFSSVCMFQSELTLHSGVTISTWDLARRFSVTRPFLYLAPFDSFPSFSFNFESSVIRFDLVQSRRVEVILFFLTCILSLRSLSAGFDFQNQPSNVLTSITFTSISIRLLSLLLFDITEGSGIAGTESAWFSPRFDWQLSSLGYRSYADAGLAQESRTRVLARFVYDWINGFELTLIGF